jgi:hypothetical protein
MKVMDAGREQLSGKPLQGPASEKHINLDPDKIKNGLVQLVLTVVKLIQELLEKQAVRRIDAGSLSEDEIEKIGLTLMRQAEEIEKIRKAFGLENEELNIDLGPLGKLL